MNFLHQRILHPVGKVLDREEQQLNISYYGTPFPPGSDFYVYLKTDIVISELIPLIGAEVNVLVYQYNGKAKTE